MGAFAVLAKALPMVRRDEHDRAAGLAPDLERLQQTPELTVHECDFSVIGRLTVPIGQVGGRRLVRRVRIVVMDPQEPGSRLRSLSGIGAGEPADHRVGRRIREPFDVRCPAKIIPSGQTVVIRLESAIESKSAIQWEPGDEPGGVIARVPKILRNGFDFRREDESAVVPKAMAKRRLAGEDGRVRRPGQWCMGHCRLEADTAERQGIDRRSGGVVVSVTPDVVGAKRINRHQEHIRPARRRSHAGLRTT